MRARARGRRFIDCQCIALDDGKSPVGRFAQLFESWQAAVIALDGGDMRAGTKQSAREAARTRPDLVGTCAREIAWNARDAIEELLVEQEVLAQRL